MMKQLLPVFLCPFILLSYANTEIESAEEFARELRKIIVNRQVNVLEELPCFPSNCIDDDDIRYIFGSAQKKSFILQFLQREDIGIKVFGPFTYSEKSNGSNYIFMYYDQALVQFDDSGYLTSKDRQELWWNSYIETVMTFSDGQWKFHRTPFYHGAHSPWSEDY